MIEIRSMREPHLSQVFASRISPSPSRICCFKRLSL
jgi:hypothetical protein